MAKTAVLAIRIIADATKAAKGLQGAGSEVSKFERGMQKANKAALGVIGGLTAVGVASFKEANALQQASGAVDSVFGKQANAVHKLAKSAASNFGLARSEYSQTAAVFGAQLRNMGISAGKLVPTTDKLIGLGSDLAATFGGSTSDAVSAIGALMRGEADPIERYGVGIKQVDVNARLAAQGQDKLTGSAKRTAETEARLALLMEQTTAAQGQRAREATTAASRQEVAIAKLKNAGAALGSVLLPVVAAIAGQFASLAGYVEDNAATFQILAGVVGTAAAAVIAINLALKAYRATVAAVVVVQKLWNVAMRANPIGLIITAVALLVAGFVLLYKRSETFRSIVQATGRAGKAAIGWITSATKTAVTWIGDKLGTAASTAKTIAVAAFNAYTKPIRTVIGWVKSLISWIKGISWPEPPEWMKKIGGGLGNLFGSYTPAGGGAGAAYARVPAVFTAPGELKAASPSYLTSRVGGRSAGGVTVIIQGAVDPASTARQVRQLLARDGWRRGAAVGG